MEKFALDNRGRTQAAQTWPEMISGEQYSTHDFRYAERLSEKGLALQVKSAARAASRTQVAYHVAEKRVEEIADAIAAVDRRVRSGIEAQKSISEGVEAVLDTGERLESQLKEIER